MGLPEVLGAHFPAHGNRQGLSLGWLTTVWLSYTLSQERSLPVRTCNRGPGSGCDGTAKLDGQGVSELDFTAMIDVVS